MPAAINRNDLRASARPFPDNKTRVDHTPTPACPDRDAAPSGSEGNPRRATAEEWASQ